MMNITLLLDVDNTLLDNDKAKADLETRVDSLLGPERGRSFWDVYERVRRECDFVDFPRTLAQFRALFLEERSFPHLAALILCYPYEDCVFPGVLQTVSYLKSIGTVAILSDGDPVFQPAKIARAGLAAAVDDNVLIYPHKELHLDEVTERLPADRYVLVDDKPGILAAAKAQLTDRLVTVLVRHGRYARVEDDKSFPGSDLTVDDIADLRDLAPVVFLEAGK
jgi:FMN phosphatase YigB (HAD superfamily)